MQNVSDWKCPKCNTEAKGIALSEIEDVGIPMCGECGEDMELITERPSKSIFIEFHVADAPCCQDPTTFVLIDCSDELVAMAEVLYKSYQEEKDMYDTEVQFGEELDYLTVDQIQSDLTDKEKEKLRQQMIQDSYVEAVYPNAKIVVLKLDS
jgi:hypothetical protein